MAPRLGEPKGGARLERMASDLRLLGLAGCWARGRGWGGGCAYTALFVSRTLHKLQTLGVGNAVRGDQIPRGPAA